MPFLQQSVVVLTSDGQNDELYTELYFTSLDGTRYLIPIGSTTDGLSVPRIVQSFVPASGNASWLAGVLHDAAYRNQLEVWRDGEWVIASLTQKQADDLFLEAMEAQGVSWLLRKAIYLALRTLGQRAFKRDRNI